LTGGEPTKVNGKGCFYKPTILFKISAVMRVAREEIFGPVAPITVVEDDSEAINLANDSEYGLGASMWTEDLDKAEVLLRGFDIT
jgi:aldehyde dehydrogenase